MAPSLIGVDGYAVTQAAKPLACAHRPTINPFGSTDHAALLACDRAARSATIRSLAKPAKLGFSSIPSQLRPWRSAAIAVVPDPMKGSSTTPGSELPPQLHVGASSPRTAR